MNKYINIITIALFFNIFCICTLSYALNDKIVVGESTRQDVIAIYGPPDYTEQGCIIYDLNKHGPEFNINVVEKNGKNVTYILGESPRKRIDYVRMYFGLTHQLSKVTRGF